jgi:predicted Zn-dependent protease
VTAVESDLDIEALDEQRLTEVLAGGDRQVPPTLAELMGMTEELAGAILAIAEGELEAGRVQSARTILEGMLEANPRDAAGWVLLARVHRSLRQPLAARFSAEVAARLEPASPATRLARAEGLLPFESERPAALELLRSLAGTGGPEAARAEALLAAIGG